MTPSFAIRLNKQQAVPWEASQANCARCY